jgi:type IX secretion system PorP/SprF family membrane protein
MRRLIIIILLSFPLSLVYGQQIPHYSLYMLNEVIVNPAALSKEKENKITLMLTDQWNSFEGAPATQSISYNHLNNKKYKRGISVTNDVTGPISNISATISGSFSIKMQERDRFALGASASLMQYKIDNSQITLENDGVFDPTLFGGVDKATGSSISIGAYYYHPNYYLGLAVPNIFGSSLNISENKDNNKLESHYYLNGGMLIKIKQKNKIIPSFMIKKQGALPIQLDLNVRGVYQDFLWTGISLRTGDAIVALFGIDYGRSSFGYSYDITTSSMSIPSAGTHGLVYSFKFKTKQRDRDKDGVLDSADVCPNMPGLIALQGCPDKDGDGIKDSEDECPEEFGLKINNGCPDKDSDGVIDSNDECPEVPGIANFKGCPDTDGDGLQDKYDECPENFGPIMNKGCPTVPGKDTVYIVKYITDTVYITQDGDNLKIPISNLKEVFKYVKFESARYILTVSSKEILDQVANYMAVKDYLEINLTGHTDNEDSDEYNLNLSRSRVETVQEYLLKKGITKSRITINWKGEREPISDNNTEEGREINRRVELEIINDR